MNAGLVFLGMWCMACSSNIGPNTDELSDAASTNVDAMVVSGQVFAHSSSQLYSVDPETLSVTLVGNFVWPNGDNSMTDIAIDRAGRMLGISFGEIYSVDPATATTTLLASLQDSFNGLSFVPTNPSNPESPEVLIGASTTGLVYEIDPMTGVSTEAGAYGGTYISSGDIVSVTGFGTVATAKDGVSPTDLLVRIDPQNGYEATLIGDTGVTDIWGLGFWKDQVYGFSNAAGFVLIDTTTGVASSAGQSNISWWGAGVTTSAPVTID